MWVAIVYDMGDKIDSHVFRIDEEEEAVKTAREWVHERYGKQADWSFHHICPDSSK